MTEQTGQGPAPGSTEGQRPEPKYKILIVDDDADILTTISTAVTALPLKVVTATDGMAAIERAEAEDPDIVVLDLMLPKRGGLQILQKIKGNPTAKGKRPLVCMVTGNEGMRHRQFADQHGVDDYLTKPFPIGRLLEIIQGFLEMLDSGIEDARPRK